MYVKKKRFIIATIAVVLSLLAICYGLTLESGSGDMFIWDKEQSVTGKNILVVAQDGSGAVYELTCTSAQFSMVDACDMISCRWTLNIITHRGKIHELYTVLDHSQIKQQSKPVFYVIPHSIRGVQWR